MRWILLAVAALAGIAGIITAVGSALPRDHVASVEATLPAPPERVWEAITATDAFPAWRSDVERVEPLADAGGRRGWIEYGSSGRLTFVVERAEAPRVLVTRIADPDLPFGGAWTYEIAPAARGSTLRITERGEVYNPIFRFMARFVFGHERTMATFLADLERGLRGPAKG